MAPPPCHAFFHSTSPMAGRSVSLPSSADLFLRAVQHASRFTHMMAAQAGFVGVSSSAGGDSPHLRQHVEQAWLQLSQTAAISETTSD